MIARLAPDHGQTDAYARFLKQLGNEGFQGEIAGDLGSRTVLATDNSIYQRLPQAAVFPKTYADVELVAKLAAHPQYRSVVLTPRGGGTGTNGQSLTDGIVVDLSRHLNGILEINVEERWVRVQSGVVKDQLNAALKPHGLFFAPELSTSNRATIGGMINTDASGQGSCTYGKTRDHVLALSTVLLGGQRLDSQPLAAEQADREAARQDRIGSVYRCTRDIADQQAQLIKDTFPPLNRCLTGYDLAHLREADGGFNLNSILCGSEGSLGFIIEAKLNVLPIPRHSILVNVQYTAFMDALRDAKALMALKPLSIETVDSKVLRLAMQDIVWHGVAEYFPPIPGQQTLGINLIEFSDDDQESLERRVHDFIEHLKSDTSVVRLGHTLAVGSEAVTRVYTMRKRSVGLLGNVQGEARPQPFVEDTAVPPENLADFIAEFRALLDSHQLEYGMFGHEHGKGLRSEYSPAYFGPLYPSLQAIKAAFDPFNQLNPGKIATPSSVSEATLTKVDEVVLRGELDRQIDERVWQSYHTAAHCNGNGACYNFDPNDAMCPSWKATRNRIHSPKGRASLVREWLRLQGAQGVDLLGNVAQRFTVGNLLTRVRNTVGKQLGEKDFSHEVYEAMAGCLACKSCAGQCPVKVNVPDFRSRFLELYHHRYLRPLKDYVVGSLEYSIPYIARFPRLYNAMMNARPVKFLLEHVVGMVDSPLLSLVDFHAVCARWNVTVATAHTLSKLSEEQRRRSVVIVQDAFTRYFETPLAAEWIELIARLGYAIYLAPFAPNGKPLQVQGFLGAFKKAAIPLVGLDPAMTLVYRQEYAKTLDQDAAPRVVLAQEWLATALPTLPTPDAPQTYQFLPSVEQWKKVFDGFGLKLQVLASGCCGMSGTYGHETRNVKTSQVIYAQSWQPLVERYQPSGRLLADGYSCRSQVKRQAGEVVLHPLQVLLGQLRERGCIEAQPVNG